MARGRQSSNRRGTPRRKARREDAPDVYTEMVAEAISSTPTSMNHLGRAPKRRRVGDQGQTRENNDDSEDVVEPMEESTRASQVQTAYAESESSEDEDEIGWEDVNVDGLPGSERESSAEHRTEDLDLILDDAAPSTTKRAGTRVKSLTAAERRLRLELHKMHLLCLLSHVELRNEWCSDIQVMFGVRNLLTERTLSYLNPNPNFSQFQKSRSFLDGLSQASELWKGKFKIEARGLRKGTWRVPSNDETEISLPDDFDPPLEREDFVKLAFDPKGSRDVGSQLFCALLRSAGVNARLVCSLQPLPLTFAPAPQSTKSTAPTNQPGTTDRGHARNPASIQGRNAEVAPAGSGIRAAHQPPAPREPGGLGPSTFGDGLRGRNGGTESFVPGAVGRLGQPNLGAGIGSTQRGPPSMVPSTPRSLGQPRFGSGIHGTITGTPGVVRRLGGSGLRLARTVASERATRAPVIEAPPRRHIRESHYPVYWVEAFDAAAQKWIPVDPLTTKTVGKPSKFEPTGVDPENSMTYVVAFEDDGTVKDVTKRYIKAFNAKTRKMRVESTPGGDVWWKKTMNSYHRDQVLDRDQVEEAELMGREMQEPMPKNIQAFKDHPFYALERHLKKNEVIHPKTEVGKVNVGKTGGSKRLEPVYRRRDVHKVRSASGWYRLGRDIKPGEQPLKHSSARRKRSRSLFEDDNSDSDGNSKGETGMYAESQTVLYEAPPIISGRVPKNSYGNIDVYVPSMVPKGGVHIPHDEAARAARLLGLDYADAVTGFEFKGRHGTAVIRGIVAPAENQEAIEAVIKGFKDEAAQAEALKKSMESLRLWRLFLAALRVKERIEGYTVEGEVDNAISDANKADPIVEDEEDGGGFFPERGQQQIAEPTVGRFHFDDNDDGGGGFFPDTNEDEIIESTRNTVDDVDSAGGGFIPDGNAEEETSELRAVIRTGMSTDDAASQRDPHGKEAVADNPIDGVEGFDETDSLFGDAGGFLTDEEVEDVKKNDPDDTRSVDNGAAETKAAHASPGPPTPAASDHAAEPPPSSIPPRNNKPNNKSNQYNPLETNSLHKRQQQAKSSTSRKRSREEAEAEAEDDGGDDDGDDASSLISHDPEDDDADPEWLMSD